MASATFDIFWDYHLLLLYVPNSGYIVVPWVIVGHAYKAARYVICLKTKSSAVNDDEEKGSAKKKADFKQKSTAEKRPVRKPVAKNVEVDSMEEDESDVEA